MPLEIRQSHIEAYLKDPVLAVWYFFGVELDDFQQARLRYMWFVPDYHDDSGIFTGKTLIAWLWAQLRCILLPSPRGFDPRIVAAFYQDISSAKTVFKPYWKKFIDTSPRFRNELQRHRGGGEPGYRVVGGGFEYVYRNGNSVLVPAIGMKEDAQKIASLRVHDGLVEEQKEIDKKSDSLDNQLLSRVNADCWNPDHPVWTNHVVLLGHAEDPATHPAYKRHKVAKAGIWDGDQETVIVTSNFRDWTEKHRHRRKDKEIRDARRKMSAAKFSQRYGGLWEYGTEDWYEPKVLAACRGTRVPVLAARDHPGAVFAMGKDTAGGASRRSDWNAMFIWGAWPVADPASVRSMDGIYPANGTLWRIRPAWAWQGKARDGGQLSGLVHRQNQRFQFGRMVYDPGGGGLWVAKELWKPVQFFDGAAHNVTGLCRAEDSGLYPEASPVLVKWAKGSVDLAHAWEEERFLVSDDGIVEAIHLKAQEMFFARQLEWQAAPEDWRRADLAALDAADRRSLEAIHTTLSQLARIKVRMTTRNGEEVAMTTRQGFRSFTAVGKKDLAYACLYGLAGLLSLLHDPDFDAAGEADAGECMVAG